MVEGGAVARRESQPVVLVAVGLLTLCALFTLYLFRGWDDNKLTSWQWVFSDGDLAKLAVVLPGAVLVAYGLSTAPLPGRRPALLLFVASFLLAAPFWSEPEVIVDAARYFTQAKHLRLHGIGFFLREWGREIPAWTDLPLLPFLYGVILSVGGEGRLPIQLFTTLLFSGTVVVTYRLGQALWDESVGFYGGALLLGVPYLLTQVPLMLVDVATMFFLTFAVLAASRAIEGGRAGWMVLAAGGVALAALSKYSAWLFLSVGVVVVLVHARRGPAAVLGRAGLVALAAGALVGAVVLPKLDVVGEQLALLRGYQLPGLLRWRESFASTFLFQTHPLLTVAAAGSVAAALRRRDPKYAILAWPVALVLLLGVERIRYLLVAFPMVTLMAAYGLREIRSEQARRFGALCVVTSSLAIALFGYLPFLNALSAVNLAEAGRYLDSLEGEAVEVVALGGTRPVMNPAVAVPLLDLYTQKRLIHRDPPAAEPEAEIERSPLRFTWEQKSPGYYGPRAADGGGLRPVAVILGEPAQRLPAGLERRLEGHALARRFERSDPWFEHQTLVRVYEPAGGAAAREGR